MPRFPWSPLLIFLSLIPDECFTIAMSSESLENQKNYPSFKFRDLHSFAEPPIDGPSEKEQVEEKALRQILRALTLVLPERYRQTQRTLIKNKPPPRVLDKSENPNASPPPRHSAPKGLAKMLDEYPKNKPSIYLQDLSSLVKRVKFPNKLQESVVWIQSDQSENENYENLSPIENIHYRKKVRKAFYPPTSYDTKRAMEMKGRCRNARKDKDGDVICFKYPKNATYYYYPAYYYPAYYYPFYYPYYYWGRR